MYDKMNDVTIYFPLIVIYFHLYSLTDILITKLYKNSVVKYSSNFTK